MKLSNEWIAGFSDGLGCFKIERTKKKTSEGHRLNDNLDQKEKKEHRFVISQDKRSVSVLYGIKEKLRCGTVHRAGKEQVVFQVSKREHLENLIVPFFQKHTLQSAKRFCFSAFKESLSKEKQKHQTTNSDLFAYNFSDNWFRGFVDAEGCFSVSLVKDYPLVQLVIGLQSKDKQVLVELQKFLKCGTLRTRKDGAEVLQIARRKDLERYVFPKLQTRGGAVMLQTRKRIKYQIFRKIVRCLREKNHHTVQGLENIKKLQNRLSKEDRKETECTTN